MTLSDAIDRVKERFPKWKYSSNVGDQVLDLRALGVVILAAELKRDDHAALERAEARRAQAKAEAQAVDQLAFKRAVRAHERRTAARRAARAAKEA